MKALRFAEGSGKYPGSLRLAVDGRQHAKMFAESPIRLVVNKQHAATFMCTPQQIQGLVFGYLLTTRRIRSLQDILHWNILNDGHEVHLEIYAPPEHQEAPHGAGHGLAPAPSFTAGGVADVEALLALFGPFAATAFSLRRLERAAGEMVNKASLYLRTGGVHSAAVGTASKLICCEDIGRSNSVDKAVGCAVLRGIDPAHAFLVVTGRVTFEMLLKAAATRIPVVASLNIPSDLTVEAAERMGITVIGKMLKEEQHIYTHAWRTK